MSVPDLVAILLTLSAGFGWLNKKFLPIPRSIGLVGMGLLASVGVAVGNWLFPGWHLLGHAADPLRQINFTDVVLNGMLGFLLFAGAINVDVDALRRRGLQIGLLAFAGTAMSAGIVGLGLWACSQLVGHPIDFAWAFVFGALIAPTDPVTVLTTLRNVDLPKALTTELEGEALFNDGIGIALFTFLLGFVTHSGNSDAGVGQALLHVLREAGGGVALGVVTGLVAYYAMRAIDDFPVEVLITLALVAGTYSIARQLGVSGPLSIVAAGLLIGERGPRDALSARSQKYVFGLWTLVDEILNSILFLLIGLEILLFPIDRHTLVIAAICIPLVLAARLLAISAPTLIDPRRFRPANIPLLTWAGVRGGISIALALALPSGPQKNSLLIATYAVVIFSVIVQGSTLGWLARRMSGRARQSRVGACDEAG